MLVFEKGTCPVVRVQFSEPTAAPTPGVLGIEDPNFNIGSPHGQSLLTQAAGSQDQVMLAISTAGDADRVDHSVSFGVRLGDRTDLGA